MSTIALAKTSTKMAINTKTDNDTKESRRNTFSIDEHYIRLYLDKPWIPKTKLYVEACELADQPVQKYKHQAAADLHNRLQRRINNELMLLQTDDKALGRAVLRHLAQTSKQDSVKASTAQTLAKGLYPDVTIHQAMTLDEINKEIRQLDRELDALH